MIDNGLPQRSPCIGPLPSHETRTDDNQAPDAFGMIQREVERNTSAHRHTDEIAALDFAGIEDGQQIVRMLERHTLPTHRSTETAQVISERFELVSYRLPHCVPRVQITTETMYEHCPRLRASPLRMEIYAGRAESDRFRHDAYPRQPLKRFPASQVMTSQVMKRASSEARNTPSAAISSAVPCSFSTCWL